ERIRKCRMILRANYVSQGEILMRDNYETMVCSCAVSLRMHAGFHFFQSLIPLIKLFLASCRLAPNKKWAIIEKLTLKEPGL
ncbi:hypothetical protein ACQP3C_29625, partial [Escherichia coli]